MKRWQCYRGKLNHRMWRRFRRLGEPATLFPSGFDRHFAYLAAEHGARDVRRQVLKALLERAGYTLADVRAADDDELADMVAQAIRDPHARLFVGDSTGDWPTDGDGTIDLYAVGRIARGIVAMEDWKCALK